MSEEIASVLVEQMPQPTDGASVSGPAPSNPTSALRDRLGRGFDPTLHITEADGTPRVSPRGFLKQRKIRRARGHNENQSTLSGLDNASVQEESGGPDYQGTAQVIGESFFALCQMLGGPDWIPQSHEKQPLFDALEKVCEKYSVDSIPCEAMLIVAVVGYTAPRALRSEGFRKRIANGWNRTKGFVAGMFGRRYRYESVNGNHHAAQSDSRTN